MMHLKSESSVDVIKCSMVKIITVINSISICSGIL